MRTAVLVQIVENNSFIKNFLKQFLDAHMEIKIFCTVTVPVAS